MDKQQTIAFIESQLAAGNISKDDLLNIASEEGVITQSMPVAMEEAPKDNSKKLMHIFYAIGAIIAVVGMCVLIGQNWDEIGFGGRVLVTVGISLVSYIAGMVLVSREHGALSQVLFTISAALAPIGAYVLLGDRLSDFTIQFATAAALCVIFGTALLITKRNILVLLTAAFASWAYVVLVIEMFGGSYMAIFGMLDIFKWAAMLLGASYILIGYGFGLSRAASDQQDEREKRAVQNVLHLLGTLLVLGTGISIGGIFDLVFIALLFAAFYGSIYLKSKAMLLFGSLFLMIHIIKMTYQYFAGSIGWPVALVVSGFAIIGVGYFTYYFNKRFIKNT